MNNDLSKLMLDLGLNESPSEKEGKWLPPQARRVGHREPQ